MRRRTFLAGASAGTAGLLVGCLGDVEGSDELPGDWSQFQADAAHTGAATASGPAGGGRVRWWSDTWGLTTAPVIEDGTVYVGSGLRNQAIFAFDRTTGERQWQAPIDDDVERAIAVGDGTVYASAGGVYALDAETGEQVWTDPTDTTRGLALDGDTVYACSGGGGPVVALETDDGEQRWRRDVHTLTAPTVADGRVFVVGNDNLVALEAESGDTEWEETIDRAGSPPTVSDGMVFTATRGGLFAHDAATGDRKWTLEGNFRATDAATIDGTLYLTGRQQDGEQWVSRALAVDAATGDVEWRRDDDALEAGSVVATAETVYVATRYRVYALDCETGEIEWWLRFQWPVGSPAVADGTLYVSVGGRLVAIGSGDGRAGVWQSDAEPIPDRSVTPPEPCYVGSDFPFGMGGFDVDAEWDVAVNEDAPVDVSFAIEGDRIDADEDVSVTLAVTNEGDEPLRFTTGAPEPFGIFRLHDEKQGHRLVAWTSAYEESGYVHTTPHRGVGMVNSIGLSTAISPGETVSESYTLSDETHGIRPGTYEFSVSHVLTPGEWGTDHDGWELEITGTVELAGDSTAPGEVVHDLAVADEVDLPEAFMGEFTVDVLEPVTDTHPGLIEITFENVTDDRSLIASIGRWPFGSTVGLGPEGRRLVLLPAETFAPGFVDRTDAGWWEPAFLPHESIAWGGATTAFDPGETSTRRFVVTTHPETDEPRDGDGYAFEQGFGDDDVDVTWGFTLSTLDPDG
ncbi:outer membrane protein assembly factor BamB family protein [Halopiger goleimassiliensis]|uniref:outer membrane protein assembly factor BamB family protein n=1 Tax=Halopiger goleimassiliensis TaxID=1293048 RepID=UPI000677C5CE|nr:PQQ-binding-like beta-propeller repeat protein [Halopiger goleimassiliensis]